MTMMGITHSLTEGILCAPSQGNQHDTSASWIHCTLVSNCKTEETAQLADAAGGDCTCRGALTAASSAHGNPIRSRANLVSICILQTRNRSATAAPKTPRVGAEALPG